MDRITEYLRQQGVKAADLDRPDNRAWAAERLGIDATQTQKKALRSWRDRAKREALRHERAMGDPGQDERASVHGDPLNLT